MNQPKITQEPRLWWLKDLGIEALSRHLAADFPKHSHDDWQVARGVDRWWHGQRWHTATPGSIMVVRPGEIHATGMPDRSAWQLDNLRLPDSAFRDLAEREGFGGSDAVLGLTVVANPRIVAWFALLWEVATASASALERSSALNGLTTALLTRAEEPPCAAGAEPRAVARAREFLHAYPTDEVSLADLAAVAGLSPFRLNRAFRAAVGVPPHAYQIQLRVRKARTLLLGGASIAEAADRAGFADQSHLGRHFKKLAAVSPGQYQRAARTL